MRLHTDNLTRRDVHDANRATGLFPDVYVDAWDFGSRSRRRAVEVYLSGTSPRASAHDPHVKAATWDEWGILLGELFRRDASLTVPRIYVDGEHFRWSTGSRYDSLTPDAQHRTHRWEFSGESVTGSYYVHTCPTCGAIKRYLSGRTSPETWAALAEL